MLWVDKYRPSSLDQLDYHHDLSRMLRTMVGSGTIPHLLVYGPSGAGKSTRIKAIMREIYGPGVERVKLEHKSFKVRSKTIELTTIGSNYHIEMNPSDAGINDRVVVQDVIKEIASSHTLDSTHQKSFKVVILNGVDRITKGAQHALRRTMEKYMTTCRLILCCESVNQVIDPLKSRCHAVRVAAPSHEEIVQVLNKVASSENITLPEALAKKIAIKSKRNLRRAILMLETCRVHQYPLKADQPVTLPEWEAAIKALAQHVCEEQSVSRLQQCREKVYEILANCIPPDVLMKELTSSLVEKCDPSLKCQIVAHAAFYEHRMQLGSKPVFHIEAFLAKFMAAYKRWCMESF